MKIAVLLSTYNGEKYIEKQLESLARQSVANYMTIYIRDDGSHDSTLEIVNMWRKKVNIVLIKGQNVGPATSFWKLFMDKEIRADYYAFCDQDDIWDSCKLEKQINKVSDQYSLCICNCRLINSEGEVVQNLYQGKQPVISLPGLFVTGVSQGCSMVFNNSLRDSIMAMNITCVPMHDIILMLYALGIGRIYWMPEPLFGYRVHDSNVVSKSSKSLCKRLKTTYWNWNNSSKNSMMTVAMELLNNVGSWTQEDETFLKMMSNYRGHLSNKLRLMYSTKVRHMKNENRRALRSYRIRIFLELL